MKLNIGKLCNSFESCSWPSCSCCSSTTATQPKSKKSSCFQDVRLFYYTFCYNEMNDSMSSMEIVVSPMISFLSHFIRYFGKLFVVLVWVLTLNMLSVFYLFIVPELFKTNWLNFICQLTLGTWLAANTFFHYAMGWLTNPGHPPNTKFDNVVSICRKCVSPKPARTHHCSICNKCVLKMDHHCPWFDNCIGFYNHRYFFLFCTFMVVDCFYLATLGFHYYQLYAFPNKNLNLFSLLVNNIVPESNEYLPGNALYHKLTCIEFFVAFAAGFALFGLASFNAYIISRGATNIELKSLNLPCMKADPNERNIYDFGFANNWKIFLGFDDAKSFLRKVVLPSSHKPLGDGVDWHDYFNYAKQARLKSEQQPIISV